MNFWSYGENSCLRHSKMRFEPSFMIEMAQLTSVWHQTMNTSKVSSFKSLHKFFITEIIICVSIMYFTCFSFIFLNICTAYLFSKNIFSKQRSIFLNKLVNAWKVLDIIIFSLIQCYSTLFEDSNPVHCPKVRSAQNRLRQVGLMNFMIKFGVYSTYI